MNASTARDGPYHHGRLREALLEEGLAAVRPDGPDHLSLREVTRAVGVTVNAAYRHFADREDYLAALAIATQRLAALHMEPMLVTNAGGVERLRSVGRGYVSFAIAEPGWFRTAFLVPTDLEQAENPAAAGDTGRTPFQLLADALDELVRDGDLPAERRLGAEVPSWSAVHGFAFLAVMGPLRSFAPADITALGDETIDAIIRGLISTR